MDWLLSHFVDLAQNDDFRPILILDVSGMIVSGELIGHTAYAQGVAAEFGLQAGSFGDLTKAFCAKPDIYPIAISRAIEVDSQTGVPAYLHLKNPTFVLGDSVADALVPGGFWRVPLSAVRGFSVKPSPSAAKQTER